MKFTAILFMLLTMSVYGICQSNPVYNKADYKDHPVWIKMMDDPNVNYYEAVEAYETYMKAHQLTGEQEEEEMLSADPKKREEYQREMKRENKKIKTDQQRQALVERDQLNYQIKRFKGWMQEVKPFVQENGHILTAEERMVIWQKQQQEMKADSTHK